MKTYSNQPGLAEHLKELEMQRHISITADVAELQRNKEAIRSSMRYHMVAWMAANGFKASEYHFTLFNKAARELLALRR